MTLKKIKLFLEMIKFEHTLFALPFAYAGYVIGGITGRERGSWRGLFWVTLAMVGARTAGMCLNRIIDRAIDAKNPRTQTRALVTGAISARLARAATILSLALLFISAARLNPLCLYLSPLAVAFLVGYHYLKRFTPLCHWGIGLVLACAPVGGWIAATGSFDPRALLLGSAVLFWTAGFDIFYSMLDLEFDRGAGLYSVPSRWGIRAALATARVCHVLTLIFLIGLGIMIPSNRIYWWGLAVAACMIAYEHYVMRNGEAVKVRTAFFNLNALISSVYLMTTVLSLIRYDK